MASTGVKISAAIDEPSFLGGLSRATFSLPLGSTVRRLTDVQCCFFICRVLTGTDEISHWKFNSGNVSTACHHTSQLFVELMAITVLVSLSTKSLYSIWVSQFKLKSELHDHVVLRRNAHCPIAVICSAQPAIRYWRCRF